MVSEISYDKYKEFCSMLPSKDSFYYINSLFVKYGEFSEDVYGIKYDNTLGVEETYNKNMNENSFIVVNKADFLRSNPKIDEFTGSGLNEITHYKGRNLLVVM